MSDIVIKVEGLSKRYRLGQYVGGAYQYRALRDVLTDAIYTPFRRLRARVKQRAVGSNPTTMSHEPSANFIWALKDVSFEVKEGEVLGIIGRNGAGKSTLLKVLSRITEPTEGRAEIKGRLESLLEVGTGFHPELTGQENIYLSGAILGMTKREIGRKFDEIVDFSGIEKFIDTPVKRYSSGMLVRLGFAIAAHLEPEILLVDEVLAVGDAAFQKKCLDKMGDVTKEGRTVLFVSHNMGAITRLCQWAIRLDGGSIVDQGVSHQVVRNYLADNIESRGHISLPPDPAKPMRLREVTVLNSRGTSSAQVEMGKPFRVRVGYDVNRAVTAAHVICFIYTSDGTNVFGTGDADAAPERLDRRELGNYEGEFEVPAFLLGEGKYSITVSLSVPFQVVYDRHEAIASFTVVDNSSARRDWLHRRRPGILGLELSWKYRSWSSKSPGGGGIEDSEA